MFGKYKVWFIGAGILFLGAYGLAHEMKEQAETKSAQASSAKLKTAVDEIGKDYQARVEPIFKKSCFDCHSNATHYPWYYRLPVVKSMIDGDIKGACKHMDMSNGCPFMGHGTLETDLQDILDVIEDGSMPPIEYRVFHWGSGLSKNEKETVKDWAQKGLEKVKEASK
jgi:hypothetical protein